MLKALFQNTTYELDTGMSSPILWNGTYRVLGKISSYILSVVRMQNAINKLHQHSYTCIVICTVSNSVLICVSCCVTSEALLRWSQAYDLRRSLADPLTSPSHL